MALLKRKVHFYFLSFLKHDFKASITVFFVALPLCLAISIASGAPFYSGLLAGIIGGVVVSIISRSSLSVSGPAAGLTAICAAIVAQSGNIQFLFLSVAIAGVLQILLGVLKMGGFTHFIPSAVIKGMLAAIGVILISKQVPLIIGYDQPDFWSNELFNIITLNNAFSHIGNLYKNTSAGAMITALLSIIFLYVWKKKLSGKFSFLPASFVTVVFGVIVSMVLQYFFSSIQLKPTHFVHIPSNVFSDLQLPDFKLFFSNRLIWENGILICIVATLETLLSIEAIDKIDPYNRITPQNRELVAQGSGNLLSGLLGGLPITAVIVRSSANAEAGAKTKLSSIFHGVWLFFLLLFAINAINLIPFCVLAVILIGTGYNLAKPSMIYQVFKQGREQFMPFIVTVIAILFTDILKGVLIGVIYSIYFLIKHTYRAGYQVHEKTNGHIKHYTIELATNVSFLNKKKIKDALDKIPEYAEVEITGTDSVYIDNDILEIIQEYKVKAKMKHIALTLKDIKEVETIKLH